MPARKFGKLYLPALSVLVSCLAPWSLTLRMTTSGQGFPFTSRIVPAIDPVWAAARGANTLASATIRKEERAHDLRKLFMLHSPLSRCEHCKKYICRELLFISLTMVDTQQRSS